MTKLCHIENTENIKIFCIHKKIENILFYLDNHNIGNNIYLITMTEHNSIDFLDYEPYISDSGMVLEQIQKQYTDTDSYESEDSTESEHEDSSGSYESEDSTESEHEDSDIIPVYNPYINYDLNTKHETEENDTITPITMVDPLIDQPTMDHHPITDYIVDGELPEPMVSMMDQPMVSMIDQSTMMGQPMMGQLTMTGFPMIDQSTMSGLLMMGQSTMMGLPMIDQSTMMGLPMIDQSTMMGLPMMGIPMMHQPMDSTMDQPMMMGQPMTMGIPMMHQPMDSTMDQPMMMGQPMISTMGIKSTRKPKPTKKEKQAEHLFVKPKSKPEPESKYEGETFEKIPHGHGKMTYLDGTVYEGNFDNGLRHGYGAQTYSNRDMYYGEWINDKEHGQGLMIYFNEDTYEGLWENGLKHGFGKMDWIRGKKYVGMWETELNTVTESVYGQMMKYMKVNS